MPTSDEKIEAIIQGLNPAQIRAVQATEGPVLILAGAGSGKTKCLTHRFAYLVGTGKARSDQILAISFTNKAAQELGGRILKILGFPLTDWQRNPNLVMRRYLPWVGTFHSICVRLLRAEAETLGIGKNFTIFDEDDSRSLIKEALKEMDLDPKQYNPTAIRSIISGAKNELLSPDQYASYVQGHFQQVALEVYRRYQKRLREAAAFDFDDLIFATVRLLEQFPAVRSKYQTQFRYVCVDEYQDTNFGQYRLTALLTNPKQQNICVVGDDYQAIYGWRGANFRNILNFSRDFPKAEVFKLEQNYRSTKTILSGAAYIIKRVKRRSEKTLWTANEDGPPITVFEARNAYKEAEFLVGEIRSLKSLNYSYPDFAVLYRTNAQSRILEEIFLAAGIPYRLVGAVRFYERAEIKDLLSYLRFVLNPDDELALKRIINLPPRGIGPKTFQAKGEKVKNFLALMEGIRRTMVENPPLSILEEIIRVTKYQDYLSDGTPEGEARWENVEELLNLAAEFASVADLLEHVALVSDVDNYDAAAEAVTLMTLHSSKGLEFTTVFLVGMEEGLFPHLRALDEESAMDEERRLCYVGMTRARKRLYLTLARQRLIHGGLTNSLPSRFIREIDESILDRI